MIGYASRTGTRRNLAALRGAGWRLLLSPTGVWNNHGFPYALDNGAWTAYRQGTEWDGGLFLGLVDAYGPEADWIVVPDVVGDSAASMRRSLEWLGPLKERIGRPLLFAVQDGMEDEDVAHLLGPDVGLFVGGTTEWKLATMYRWAALSRAAGCWCHVGRVNTARRIRMCHEADVDSFDGTSPSRYAKTLPRLDLARRQPSLWASIRA